MSFAALISACTSTQKESLNRGSISSKATIDSLLNEWHASASEADYAAYFGFMDSASVFIGTDATENWTKEQFKTFSKPYFDKGKAWSFMAFERNIYFNSDSTLAWFDELLDTWMGVCRGSGVLEYINEQWKLRQYVLSVAIPNESMNEVIIVKQGIDSLFRVQQAK
jgi:hypothetical protein